MSVILRTAGIDRTAEELAWDLENLLKVWQAILDTVLKRSSPFLIYRESNAVIRALRDYLSNDIGEILVDDEATFREAMEFVEQVMPHNARKLKHYTDAVPLFTRFQIESQIESAFAHQVSLPSGRSIVIDHTEALVSIDVNSARATKGGDIEATALNTNLEAAEEVARQLRIRDLGGLVVIDFIDMGPQRNQRDVENRLRDAVRQDRARGTDRQNHALRSARMSRQRLRPSIGESAYQSCPRCSGFGTIRSIESLALAILRIIGEEARKERTAKVIAQLPVEVATYLNEKRNWVQSLEATNDVQVILVARTRRSKRRTMTFAAARDDQAKLPENAGVSYLLAESDPLAEPPQYAKEPKPAEQAAIGVIAPSTPAPVRKESSGGVWAWLKGLFAGDKEERPKKNVAKTRKSVRQRTVCAHPAARTRRSPGRSGTQSSTAEETSGQEENGRGGQRRSAKTKSQDAAAKPAPERQQAQGSAGSENRDEQKRSSRSRRSRGGATQECRTTQSARRASRTSRHRSGWRRCAGVGSGGTSASFGKVQWHG